MWDLGNPANGGTSSCFQGYGIQFFGSKDYYEGEWCGNQRSGWGRMYYPDGNIYEGQWQNDKPEGEGMLRLSECPAPMKPRPPTPLGPAPSRKELAPDSLPHQPSPVHNSSLVGPEKVIVQLPMRSK